MGNIRLQRITRIRDKRYTGIRMPTTEQDVKNQQRKAKIIVIRGAFKADKLWQGLQLWRRKMRHADFA